MLYWYCKENISLWSPIEVKRETCNIFFLLILCWINSPTNNTNQTSYCCTRSTSFRSRKYPCKSFTCTCSLALMFSIFECYQQCYITCSNSKTLIKLWTCISQCSLGITFFLFYFKIWWVVILKLVFIYLFSIFSPQVYHFFPLQQLRQDEHHTNMKINRIIITRWVEPCFLHFCSITLHMTLCSIYHPLLSGPAFV